MKKKSDDTVHVTFRCPKDMHKALEDARWSMRKTKSELLIEAVREWLERHAEKPK